MMPLRRDEDKIRTIRLRLDRPIAMIGMMGAGKTRLGKTLADSLNLPFIDTDDEIEKAAGMSISDIFERFGEPYFRDGERRVLRRVLDDGLQVIATGGGAVMNPETAADLWEKTVTVWIKADLGVMLERASRNDRRPLLKKGDPETIFKELAAARYPFYEKANLVIESDNSPVETVCDKIIDAIHFHLIKGGTI